MSFRLEEKQQCEGASSPSINIPVTPQVPQTPTQIPPAVVYYYPQFNPNDYIQQQFQDENKNYNNINQFNNFKNQYQNNKNNNNYIKLDYSKDYGYSITFLVCGIFFFLPLLFNLVYIRSPNNKARNIVVSSLILSGVYFFASMVYFLYILTLNEIIIQ